MDRMGSGGVVWGVVTCQVKSELRHSFDGPSELVLGGYWIFIDV